MEVITTHTNADFDAMASMVAANRLYPDAKIVFPGSQERNVRNFIAQNQLDFMKARDLRMEEVHQLILVDNKNADRLGPLSDIAKNPGMRIHIYDHHPHGPGDLHGETERIEQLGATTTLLVEIIQERRIVISPFEATLFALGIYEETGSLTFTSTTPRDLHAAAFLLAHGADLKAISGYLVHELDADQVTILNDLLHSAKPYYLDGFKVVIAKASSERYVAELSTITHKVRDMGNLDVLFVLVRMDDKLQMVARSRIAEVDVGEIAGEFGGGGHATAAAAAIRDLTSIQVEEKILHTLRSRIKPSKLARDIMTSPVKTVSHEVTILAASDMMTKFGVSVLPITQGERFIGLVTREILQKAIFHQLGESPITDFMSTDFQQVSPETPFRDVETLMIDHNQRFMPAVIGKQIVGAITRTDLLRALHEDVSGRAELAFPENIVSSFKKNLRGLIHDRLPARVEKTLIDMGRVADELGVEVYLVGGFVRDLLMGCANLDIDLVVEGDGIAFSQHFGRIVKARVKTYPRFGTAVIVYPDGFKVDVATARTEFYEFPTALPTVELSSIKKDLYRRDFTINTLAVRLNKKEFGALIDFFGGQRDIKDRTVRVLHNLSFVEDPTRIYRAIRFEQRLDFKIAKHTSTLMKSAVKMDLFHRISGIRVYDELVLLLSEEEPVKAIRRMTEFDLLRFIHPSLSLGDASYRLFEGIQETLAWYKLLFLGEPVQRWILYLMGFLDNLSEESLREVFSRFAIPDKLQPVLLATKHEFPEALVELSQEIKPGRVYAILHPLPLEVILFMMSKAPQERVKKQISLYLTRLQQERVLVTGKDLEHLGIPRGPLYTKLLHLLLEARLNGEVTSRDEELSFVKAQNEKLKTSDRGPKKKQRHQRGKQQQPPQPPERPVPPPQVPPESPST